VRGTSAQKAILVSVQAGARQRRIRPQIRGQRAKGFVGGFDNGCDKKARKAGSEKVVAKRLSNENRGSKRARGSRPRDLKSSLDPGGCRVLVCRASATCGVVRQFWSPNHTIPHITSTVLSAVPRRSAMWCPSMDVVDHRESSHSGWSYTTSTFTCHHFDYEQRHAD
jgi:hypothetical protein